LKELIPTARNIKTLKENKIITVEFESSNSPKGIDNKSEYKNDIIIK